jgi:1,4-dihydroxy-2-naphthoate octaprenyltransferase
MSPKLRLPRISRPGADAGVEGSPDAESPSGPAAGDVATGTAAALVEPALTAEPVVTSGPGEPVDEAREPEVRDAAAPTAPEPAEPEPAEPEPAEPEPAEPEPAEPEPEAPAQVTVDDGIARLATFRRAVLSWVAEDGYPVNVDVEIDVRPAEGAIRFSEPPGFRIAPGTHVAITGSYIHTLPEGGFDRRGHVTLWGVAAARPRARFVVTPGRVWAWDEGEVPLPAAYERDLRKARRYFDRLSAERGVRVRPRMSKRLLLFRATRAPFLTATLAPVLLGLAVAARAGIFDAASALITLVAASAVHLGLNVANDVFDTLQGTDDANATPTKFSGGSRVLQNALVTIREMSMLAIGCYALAAVLGIALLALRGSTALVAIAVLGFVISVAYTMPPFKLVYRGLGEIATAIGFGPVMLLGAYTVQSRGAISVEACLVSVPVALLVALILYVNEIPDRVGDASAGKMTLPVRWPKETVIRVFDVAAAAAFIAVVGGVLAGLMPIPTLLVLLAIPLALQIHAGLNRFYDNPYALMSTMAANIQLHMNVSLLLLAGYLLTIVDQLLFERTPFLW